MDANHAVDSTAEKNLVNW